MRDRGGVFAHRHRAIQQQRPSGGTGAVEQLGTLGIRCVDQRRLEQRPYHAEGELTLLWAGRRATDRAAGARRDRRGLFEQSRLAESGGAVNDDDAAGAIGQPVDRVVQDVELGIAFDQRPLDGGRDRGRGLEQTQLS